MSTDALMDYLLTSLHPLHGKSESEQVELASSSGSVSTLLALATLSPHSSVLEALLDREHTPVEVLFQLFDIRSRDLPYDYHLGLLGLLNELASELAEDCDQFRKEHGSEAEDLIATYCEEELIDFECCCCGGCVKHCEQNGCGDD